MTNIRFDRQSDEPLYPKILWNRPVARSGAGRLLVVGGHTGEFSLVTAVHEAAMAAGAGECTVVLPDALLKLLAGAPDTVFVPSSPSGSLGREALGQVLQLAEESDAVAIGANLSANSHTTILIERLLQEADRPIIAFGDALTAARNHLPALTSRPENLIIATMPEIFKLAGQLNIPINIRPDGGILNKVEIIASVRAATSCSLVVYGSEIIVAAGGDIVVTPVNYRLSLVPSIYYAVLSVFWIQNRPQAREGLATAAYVLGQASQIVGNTDRPSTTALAREITRLLSLEA
jgi:NAD(P)H-hydrate repair Nnr-like enzyme with NAD(P)H-hydrate dehydratase domain